MATAGWLSAGILPQHSKQGLRWRNTRRAGKGGRCCLPALAPSPSRSLRKLRDRSTSSCLYAETAPRGWRHRKMPANRARKTRRYGWLAARGGHRPAATAAAATPSGAPFGRARQREGRLRRARRRPSAATFNVCRGASNHHSWRRRTCEPGCPRTSHGQFRRNTSGM
jgi:hypothetical protein